MAKWEVVKVKHTESSRRGTTIVAACALAVSISAVAGCGLLTTSQPVAGGTGVVDTVSPADSPSPVEDSTSPSQGPASPPSVVATPSAAPILPDGRSPVYLTDLHVGDRTVTFDLLEFLTDAQAKKKWLKAHPGQLDYMPEDYFIVNNNKELRTLPIAARVKVKVVSFASAGVASRSITLADLPDYLANNTGTQPDAGDRRLSTDPFWLTVVHGEVTVIDEMYMP